MAKREYATDEITVHWDSDRCIHSGVCLRRLPEVFDFDARPWVNVTGADAATIADAIDHCPSGALRYERPGAAAPDPDAITRVIPWPNGPLMLKGNITLRSADGEVIAEGTRMSLCRCGASQNQPFCDNSHRQIGFTDKPQELSEERAGAESPQQVHDGQGVD